MGRQLCRWNTAVSTSGRSAGAFGNRTPMRLSPEIKIVIMPMISGEFSLQGKPAVNTYTINFSHQLREQQNRTDNVFITIVETKIKRTIFHLFLNQLRERVRCLFYFESPEIIFWKIYGTPKSIQNIPCSWFMYIINYVTFSCSQSSHLLRAYRMRSS